MTPEKLLAMFQAQYSLERRWADILLEQRPFERQQYQWWDWYYYDQWNWRSMTKEQATIVWPTIREKARKQAPARGPQAPVVR